MVNQVARRTRSDFLAVPALLLLGGTILWIAYDLFTYYKQTSGLANKAIALDKAGESRQALDLLLKVRDDSQPESGLPAAWVLQRLPGGQLNFDRQFGAIYRNLGHYHAERQESALAVRAYTMALLHEPGMRGVAFPLAQGCFFIRNYELGYFSSCLAEKEGAAQATAMKRYFSKHYRRPGSLKK